MDYKYNSRNARALTTLMEQRFESFAMLVRGHSGPGTGTLARMLADGKFPATESKALQDALDKVEDALSDLTMTLCLSFDIESENKL